MGLGKEEWDRRLKAGLALNDMTLVDLRAELLRHGLPADSAARAGRPADPYQPNHALAMVVAEVLGMPTAWFEAEDWRPLLSEPTEAESLATAADLEVAVGVLNEGLAELHKEIGAVRTTLGRGGGAQEGRNG